MYPTKAQLLAATAEGMREYIEQAIELARLDTIARSQDQSWLKERGILSLQDWVPTEHAIVIDPSLPPRRTLTITSQRDRILWMQRLKLHVCKTKPTRHYCYALCTNYIAKGVGTLSYHGAVVRYEEDNPASLWVMAPASAVYVNVAFTVPTPPAR